MKKASVKRNQKPFKIIKTSDWHAPFQDDKVLNIILQFAIEVQPDIIIFDELHDFFKISKFEKDLRRKENLQDEIDIVNDWLAKFRKALPKARFILLNSNHLARLHKYILNHAPELSCLRQANLHNLPALLELEKNKVEFMPYFVYKNVLYKHGDVVAKNSGQTAVKEFLKEISSGQSGHTHRLSLVFITKRIGEFFWAESGCGCLNMDYVKDTSGDNGDWQRGFLYTEYYPDGTVVTPMHIKDHKLHYNGITIK